MTGEDSAEKRWSCREMRNRQVKHPGGKPVSGGSESGSREQGLARMRVPPTNEPRKGRLLSFPLFSG